MKSAEFRSAPTVVGSFPHTDVEPLVECLLSEFSEVVAWPQMPVRDWRESMYVQYSEGLPGVTIDTDTQRLWFRTDNDFHAQLEAFYQAVVEENVDAFAISRQVALGLHCMMNRLRAGAARPAWLKGQVTGPFSFAMTVTDENKRALAYNPELHEVAVQGMAMKARWMARRLRDLADGVIVVLDEPYLCSYGSAFVNVSRDEVTAALCAAVDGIHKEGALAGLHCCGNTDWSLVLDTGLDVLNFDAYEFFQGMPLYPAELRSFVDRGGVMSWGIVPTSSAIDDVTPDILLKKLDERAAALQAKGIDRGMLYRQSLLTPSCGMGTQTVQAAERVLETLLRLSELVREREGLG